MRMPLRTKFSMLVLGLILIMMFSIWLLSIRQQTEMEVAITDQQRNALRGELAKRAGNIFSFLAANSEALAIGDYLTVDAFVREITATSPDILFIHIVKKGRLVVPISDTGAPSTYQPPPWQKPAGDTVQFLLIETPQDERVLLATGPIIDHSINVRVADAYVAISRKPIQEAVAAAQAQIKTLAQTARHNMTFATAVFAVIGVIGSILLVTYVVRPINSLARGAKIIGEGNLDHEVEVNTNDEVGDLARMFNVMTKNLKEDQSQLVEKEKLEQELRIATEIQYTLLPKSLPRTPGFDFGAVYTAAKEVGGDYYDFMNIQDNGRSRIALAIADVSGKGIPGAFMMAVTRSVLRATAVGAMSPVEVLKSTNAILYPDIKRGMFVSMFYGLLDAATGEIEFSGVGHNPTILYRAGSRSIEMIRCKGLALGLRDPSVFDRLIESKHIALGPGDILIQYTDGIQHAMNAAEERFGMDRLLTCIREHSHLAAQALLDKVMNSVVQFTAGFPQFDDITMVAVKRRTAEIAR